MACAKVNKVGGLLHSDVGHVPGAQNSLFAAIEHSTSSPLAVAHRIQGHSTFTNPHPFILAASKPGAFSGRSVERVFQGNLKVLEKRRKAIQILASSTRKVKASAATLDTVDTVLDHAEEENGAKAPASVSGLRVYIILVPLDLPSGFLAAAVDFTRIAFKQRMEHAMTLVEGPDGKVSATVAPSSKMTTSALPLCCFLKASGAATFQEACPRASNEDVCECKEHSLKLNFILAFGSVHQLTWLSTLRRLLSNT